MIEKIPLNNEKFADLWNPEVAVRLWHQWENEKTMWYDRFRIYLFLGPSRSLLKSVNIFQEQNDRATVKTTPYTWTDKSREFEWKARAEAFDQAVNRLEEEEWANRQETVIRRDWDMAEKLFEKVQQMLEFPVTKVIEDEIEEDGKTIHRTVITPMKWTPATLVQMAEAASKLARLSAGMATEKNESEEGNKVLMFIPSNGREVDTDLSMNEQAVDQLMSENIIEGELSNDRDD